ncbi:MAG: hypothetical protein WCL34_15380 [Methylococcaceae bacterium]
MKVGATDVALEQVTEGNALVFHQNPNASADLLKAEDVAKSQNLGFWAELGSNESVQNWVDSAIPDASTQSDAFALDLKNYAAENERAWKQIGWGAMTPCSKVVMERKCIGGGWSKICGDVPVVKTASQKWTVDMDVPDGVANVGQFVQQQVVNAVTAGVKSAITSTLTSCSGKGIAAAGVSSFFTSPATAAGVFMGVAKSCVVSTFPANLANAFVRVPRLDSDALTKVNTGALDAAKAAVQNIKFRAGSSCAW